MEIIAARYGILRGELLHGWGISFEGRTDDDMLADTFEYVIRENLDLLSDDEVIAHFKKKFLAMKMQTLKDYKSKMKYHADNQQT